MFVLFQQMDPADHPEQSTRNQYGVLKLETSPPATSQYTSLSFANPAYEPQSNGPTYKVEDVVVQMDSSSARRPSRRWRGFKSKFVSPGRRHSCIVTVWLFVAGGMIARWEVAKSIWPYMLTISLAYFVTLCLYPGIESEITSCRLGSWMPVIIMAIFNASDLFGKVGKHEESLT
jgi:solute carrier family 29 (equilibrative nucleoside transporter) protein 4